MIDTKELRASIKTIGVMAVSTQELSELLDRLEEAESDALEEARLNGMGAARESALIAKLEAAEKERDDVAQQLVQSEQGKRKISEECDELRNEIACVKEVEFPRKAQAVADAWKGKCERLEAERNELRAKIERMTKRLRLILEEPENTMSNSKAMREMIRQARLALDESK